MNVKTKELTKTNITIDVINANIIVVLIVKGTKKTKL